jgi:hypothetical protein
VVEPVVPERRVILRDWQGRDEDGSGQSRFLEAYLDEAGNLHIDGQDIGGAAHLISDGEYEWFQEIAAVDVPALRRLLDIGADEDLLGALETRYSGEGTYELEKRLRLENRSFEIRRETW